MSNPIDFQMIAKINAAFTPSTPINSLALFSGRQEQMQRLIGACFQPGQHVILYGERGVGKTSLARIIIEALAQANFTTLKSGTVNCDGTDDFSSIWHKALKEILVKFPKTTPPPIGFQPVLGNEELIEECLDDLLPEIVKPDDVRQVFGALKTQAVIVIDELDRLEDKASKTLLADTIKTMSDHVVPVTIILIGVAPSVNELIAEHHSIDRALVQIHTPRMSSMELLEIITKGEQRTGLSFTREAREMIVGLSKGLPHYTHLLCLNASELTVHQTSKTVDESNVSTALATIVRNKTTVSTAYDHAISSSHKDSIHERVLVACGMCHTDQDGYFSSPDVANQLEKLLNKECPVSVFSRHLNEFCSNKRGPVLARKGTERRYRFRFIDPLMQPFATMQGITKGIIEKEALREMVQMELGLDMSKCLTVNASDQP